MIFCDKTKYISGINRINSNYMGKYVKHTKKSQNRTDYN